MEGSIGWLFDCVGVPQSSFCGEGLDILMPLAVVSEEDKEAFDDFLRAAVIHSQFGGRFQI